MTEQLLAPTTFEDQLRNVQSLESQNGQVRYVELTPDAPESDVPIMLLGGFGTDIESTALAAQRLFDQGRPVIMIDRPPMKNLKGQPLEGIDGDQMQYADNVNEVANATGHKKLDIIAQSEAAVFATAAALKEPERFRSLVIESGAGMVGKKRARDLISHVAMDSIFGAPRYLQDISETVRYNKGMLEHVATGGARSTLKEIKSIGNSRIDQALVAVRRAGINVAYIHANSDGAFSPQEVGKNIVMDMENGSPYDNVDVYSSIADKNARHGSLLFDEKGVYAALSHIRQFEANDGRNPAETKDLAHAA